MALKLAKWIWGISGELWLGCQPHVSTTQLAGLYFAIRALPFISVCSLWWDFSLVACYTIYWTIYLRTEKCGVGGLVVKLFACNVKTFLPSRSPTLWVVETFFHPQIPSSYPLWKMFSRLSFPKTTWTCYKYYKCLFVKMFCPQWAAANLV